MRKISLILFILILFLAMGSVAAEGNFTQLNEEITTASDVYEFSQNYSFTDDESYDPSDTINLENDILLLKEITTQ